MPAISVLAEGVAEAQLSRQVWQIDVPPELVLPRFNVLSAACSVGLALALFACVGCGSSGSSAPSDGGTNGGDGSSGAGSQRPDPLVTRFGPGLPVRATTRR